MSLEDGVNIIHSGVPCWGCIDLEVKPIPFVCENFFCKKNNLILGRIGRIMEGCIVPREFEKGCRRGKNV